MPSQLTPFNPMLHLLRKGIAENQEKLNRELYQAVRTNRTVDVQAALQRGAEANLKIKGEADTITLLYLAIAYSGINIIRALIGEQRTDLNAQMAGGKTALHYAILCDKTDIALALIKEQRANLNAQMAHGETALHYAILCNRTDIALALIKEQRTNLNAQMAGGKTALHCAIRHQNLDILAALLKHNADTTHTVRNAIENEDLKTVRLFLKELDDLEQRKALDPIEKSSIIHSFINTKAPVIAIDSTDEEQDEDEPEESGEDTLLILAARHNDTELLKRLIGYTNEAGEPLVDINAKNKLSYNALDYAIEHQNLDMLAALLKHNADTTHTVRNAIENEDLKTVRLFLKELDDLEQRKALDPIEKSSIIHSFINTKAPVIAIDSTDEEQDEDEPEESGEDTLLILAARHNDTELLKRLIGYTNEAGEPLVDINAKNKLSYNALDYAIEHQNLDMLAALLKHNADTTHTVRNAIENEDLKTVRLFLEQLDELETQEALSANKKIAIINQFINFQIPDEEESKSLLMLAAEKNDIECIKKLLGYKDAKGKLLLDINRSSNTTKKGYTTLHEGYTTLHEGYTALHYACENGNLESVRALLTPKGANGIALANPSLQYIDDEGSFHYPIDLAGDHHDIIELLLNSGTSYHNFWEDPAFNQLILSFVAGVKLTGGRYELEGNYDLTQDTFSQTIAQEGWLLDSSSYTNDYQKMACLMLTPEDKFYEYLEENPSWRPKFEMLIYFSSKRLLLSNDILRELRLLLNIRHVSKSWYHTVENSLKKALKNSLSKALLKDEILLRLQKLFENTPTFVQGTLALFAAEAGGATEVMPATAASLPETANADFDHNGAERLHLVVERAKKKRKRAFSEAEQQIAEKAARRQEPDQPRSVKSVFDDNLEHILSFVGPSY